ncbi:carboxypeptidase regulatory-like domain-containing protein [Sandarakinorhabdus sp.]|uniref:TonB-dependent receptor n=1 Tax=Sandarakinorhabdus sp. TaxID=1916663 RepID=UPI00286E6D75|nr:carboxypeptidase regulatory-like domain-containing protein [Sandarakinorhabdus sp.]
MRHLRLGCALAALVVPAIVQAQETSSAIRGSVVNEQGAAVAGATVVVVHTPSGTRVTQTSGAGGEFNASGLRLGGPYSITVEAAGFDQAAVTIDSLTAGVPQRVEVMLAAAGQTMVVTAARQKSAISLASGPATVLTERDIRGISTVNRDIRNLAARDPLVSLDPTNGGAISIAGQNNRFNRITVDGIAFGDPFGLEAGGLASARGPVPLDAIGEFSVEVAPVDIQQGFFQGGAINTQLKSGTNEFHGTGFYTYSGDSLRGKQTGNLRLDRDFQSQAFGAQITGPIIKDTLFFAVTWERLRDKTPANVTAANLNISQAQLDGVTATAKSRYSYDPLGVPQNVPEQDDKVVAKIDWNIADGHRAAFTYIYNKGNLLAGQTPDSQLTALNPTLSLQSNSYSQGTVNHFGVFQLNDQWSDNFSTQLRVSYNDYVRIQEPFNGRTFGQFSVCLDPTNPLPPAPGGAANGSASNVCSPTQRRIQFGPDISRQANELFSQSLNFEFQASLKMNNHTVKFIAERRRQDVQNLFAQRVSGDWLFDSLADYNAGNANNLDFAVPLRGGIDTVTADFQNNTWTAGIMDTWDVNDTLSITGGVRYDLFDTPDRPFYNADFVARTGFANTATLNGRGLFQPRLAVDWQPSDRLQLRASAGLFGGGSPNVWISNNYSNPGPTLGRAQLRRNDNGTFSLTGVTGIDNATVQALGAATLNNVNRTTGVPQALIDVIRTQGAAASPTNELDPNFKIPSQWRFTMTADYEADLGFLGDGWNFGADVIYSRVKNALTWTDLRSVANTAIGQQLTPDGRPRYLPFNAAAGINNDMLLTNTTLGYSWNVVARVDKRWENGFRFSGAYTFQRAKDLNNGTSSVALSNYNNSAAGIDPNNAAFGTSSYQRDNAIRLTASYDKNLFGDNNTRIELFFNSLSGQNFSYTMGDTSLSGSNRSNVFGVTGNNTRFLMYVPNVSSATADPRVQYAAGFDFNAFQQFIQNGDLNEFQGQIAPKNIGRAPRFNKLDLSIRQELPFVFGGKAEVFADFENLLNLIDKDWGQLRQVSFPGYGAIVNVQCVSVAGSTGAANTAPGQACAQYRYAARSGTTVVAPPQVVSLQPSLWQIRVGARVRF